MRLLHLTGLYLGFVIAFLAGGAGARAEVEFVGVLVTSQQSRFALHDTASGRTEWLEIGGGFAGFTVAAYQPAADTLVLRREGKEQPLRLKDSAKIQAGRLELAGTITFGEGQKLEVLRATLAYDQETVFPLKDGIRWRITPTRREDGTTLYRLKVERVDATGRTEQISAPGVVAPPGKKFEIRLDDLQFAFTPSGR